MYTNMEVDDASAARGQKRPAAVEEQRVKISKAHLWDGPAELSVLRQRTRLLGIQTAAMLAHSRKYREELARKYPKAGIRG